MHQLGKIRVLCFVAICVITMAISGCGDSGSGDDPWGGTSGGGYFDDASLSASIKTKLAAIPELAPLGLKVRVENSEVFLSGTAGSQEQVDHAVMQAWLVEGVKKVENEIVLGSLK